MQEKFKDGDLVFSRDHWGRSKIVGTKAWEGEDPTRWRLGSVQEVRQFRLEYDCLVNLLNSDL